MIIGLAGRAGSGKDTIADFLISDGIVSRKQPFAKALKDCCGLFFGIPRYDLYHAKNNKTNITVTSEIVELIPSLDMRIGDTLSVREVLQYFGTNIMRKFYSNIWIDATMNTIDSMDNIVISDVRFPNEAESIKKNNGIIIRLTRNPYNMEHESETIMDNYDDYDYVVDNMNQTPRETFMEVKKLIQKEQQKQGQNK